ncbi:MAG: SGNH/GDSL hydrolase family protein [Solirubrobacterales bacterium]|nr:SGNH/GDSL hydrolase family protein [Solirubrobacterales bacterium]
MPFLRLALLSTLVAAALPAPAQAAPLYVALGDSYTAGPLILNQVGTPIDCARSDNNYPSLTARSLGLTLRDVSCSSATTEHMENPQGPLPLGGTNPPQFNGVSADADIVTVGIGGNDAGLVGVAIKCIQLGTTAPTGTACRDFYNAGGVDRVAAKIEEARPKIAAVLQGVHARAPKARVALVGYPAAAPIDGRGCYPVVPASPDDLAYLNELLIRINAMMAEVAGVNDAEFVDIYTSSQGHDVCQLPPTRWYEGLVPTEPAFPVHPNVRGEADAAKNVIAVLSRPRPVVAAPVAGALRQRRVARRVGPPPRFSFTLDRAATVRLTLNRRVADKRYGAAKSITERTLAAGRHIVSIPRKVLGRRVGAYKITVTPTAGGASGRPAALRFRIAKPKAKATTRARR